MSAGGMPYCDDCGWQACLNEGCCLEAEAEARNMSPADLELDLLRYPAKVLTVPELSSIELEELATSLKSNKLSTGGDVVPLCVVIDAPPASMPAGTGSFAPLKPCSGGTPFSHDGDF